MKNKRNPSQSGVTLIEIIMVILIIGLSTAIIAPKLMQSSDEQDMEAEVRKLMMKIRVAQQKAITEETNCGITFDIGNEQYTAYYYDGGYQMYDQNTLPDTLCFNQANFNGYQVTIPGEGVFPFLEFDHLGSPVKDGSIEFCSTNNSLLVKTVNVKPVTGALEVGP